MAEIVFLCGKVGSGKTYYAGQLAADKGFFPLSCDDLMLTLFDECIGQEMHNRMVARCMEFLRGLALRLLDRGVNVVLDYGFWTRNSRDDARQFFSSRGHTIRLVYVCPQYDTITENLRRRNLRLAASGEKGYRIDGEMRRRFDSLFEPPEPDEDFLIAWSGLDPLSALD